MRIPTTWRRGLAAAVLVLAAAPAAAGAQSLDDPQRQWLPSTDGASWTYAWSNSSYAPMPRRETYRVTARDGASFRLGWTEQDLPSFDSPTSGEADFKHTDAGLVNSTYQSTAAPSQFPVLCASTVRCGNSLAGTLFMVFWGSRSSVLPEPLVPATSWDATGGAEDDVTSRSRYVRVEKVTVPAFPTGVTAVKVVSEVTQAGAIGDPFGTGVRTVWWVYGVGPVKVTFQHAGGETSSSALEATTLQPLPTPAQLNPFPLQEGSSAVFRWRNSRHMKAWSRQRFTTSRVLNSSARVDVEDVAGPIDVRGTYVVSRRLSGVRLLDSALRRADVPPGLRRQVGPTGGKRRFVTPYDLLTWGFGPIVTAYPAKGQGWRSSVDSRDWRTYRVIGDSTVVGRRAVKTGIGRFPKALVVRSQLREPGNRYGSGTRTAWFAQGRGLVKLVFRHGDGSVSTVERLR